MNTRQLARCGLLTAAAVVLLYLGGLSPYWGAGLSIAAGVLTAVPLIKHAKIRQAVLLYMATAVLGLLIVPRKSLMVAYIGVCGLYPIIKYLIEAKVKRAAQRPCKLLYGALCFVLACAAIRLGFLPSVTLPSRLRLLGLFLAAYVVFMFYDTLLSRLIATMRRALPPD